MRVGAHAGKRNLCICADDFGLHPAIDAGILQLAAQGRLQAVSVMSQGPAWADDAPALRTLADRGPASGPNVGLDIGLHLDLNAFAAAALRHSLPWWIVASHLRLVDRQALAREIDGQLDAFERHRGAPPDYIDGHQHVHQLPVVRDCLLQSLLQRWPSHRPWLRASQRSPLPGDGPGQALKGRLIEALGARALRQLARRHGLPQNRRLLGVYDFGGGAPHYRQLLAAWLAAADDGDLLMCHPALAEVRDDPIAAARVAEFTVLGSAEFAAWCDAAGLQLSRLNLGPAS